MSNIPMPSFEIEDDNAVPTEPKIPVVFETKEDLQQGIMAMLDIATVAGACFTDVGPSFAPKDAKLAELCDNARKACDALVSHLIACTT